MAALFGRQNPRILIVDADEDTRELYGVVLGEVSRAIVEACDGVEAYGRALACPPDLVLTERRLPRLDGLALVRKLRAEPRCRDCAIVVATATLSEADAEQLAELGVEEVVFKPIDLLSLVATVQRLTWRASCGNPDGLFGGLPNVCTISEYRRSSAR